MRKTLIFAVSVIVAVSFFSSYVYSQTTTTKTSTKKVRYSRKVEKLLEEAREYEFAENFNKAIAVCEKILTIDKNNLEALKMLKNYYSWTDQEDKALYALERINRVEPNNEETLKELAERYGWQDRGDKAIEAYEQGVKISPNDVDSRKKLAQFYTWNDRPKDAIEQYEKVLEIEPDNVTVRKDLANLYSWSDMPEKAIPQLEELLKRDPDNVDLMEKLADHYMWTDQQEKAMEMYNKVLQIDPGKTEARRNLADLYTWNSRAEDAMKQYFRTLDDIKTKEDRSRVYSGIAENYYWTGSYHESKRYYEKILELDPTNVEARNRLYEVERYLKPTVFAQSDILKEKGDIYTFVETVGMSYIFENDVRVQASYAISSLYAKYDEDHEGVGHRVRVEASKYLGSDLTGFVGLETYTYRTGRTGLDWFARWIKTLGEKLTIEFGYEKTGLERQHIDDHRFGGDFYYDINSRMALSGGAGVHYLTKGDAPYDNYGVDFSISPIFHIVLNPIVDLSYTYYEADFIRKETIGDGDDDDFDYYEEYYPRTTRMHGATLYARKDISDRLWIAGSDTLGYWIDERSLSNTVYGEVNYRINDDANIGFLYIWNRQPHHREWDRIDDQQFTVNYSQSF